MAAFEMRNALKLLKQRIRCMDVFDKFLYYGDNSGTVYACEFVIKRREVVTEKIAKARISKAKIDCVKVFKHLNFLAVLLEGRLDIVDRTSLETEYNLGKDGVSCFAISENSEIAIAVGKKLMVKFYDSHTKKFLNKIRRDGGKLLFPENILKLTWNGEYLGVIHKKAYSILNPSDEEEKELCNLNSTLYPGMAVYEDLWLVLDDDSVSLYTRVGKSMNWRAEMAESSKVDPIVSMLVMDNYLLLFRESKVGVYNISNLKKIHEIGFERGTYRDAAVAGDDIILVMDVKSKKGNSIVKSSALSYMRKVPVEDQIEYFLATSQVPQARELFVQNYSKLSDYSVRRELFEIDAGWAFIVKLEFEEALVCFSGRNFDPRDLLTLVPEVLDSEYRQERYITLQMLVASKDVEESKKMEEGIDMIIKLVSKQHKNLIESHNERLNDKITFVWPSLPMNDFFKGKENTLREILFVIETGLIRLYLIKGDACGLRELADSVNELCIDYKELEIDLERQARAEPGKDILQVCQAILHEKQGNYEQALAIWKQYIISVNKTILDLARKSMVDLLRNKVQEKKVIQDYARRIIVLNPDEAVHIFANNPNFSQIMTEDEVYHYLSKKEEHVQRVKEKYLEYLVNRPDTEERFFTFLGMHYLDKVEEAKKMEEDKAKEDAKENSEFLSRKYREVLRTFLKNYDMYSAQTLLERIKKLDLFEEENLIHSKAKNHSMVLNNYINREKDELEVKFTMAENYCLEQSEPLLDILFEKVLELYTSKRISYLIKEKELTSHKGPGAPPTTETEVNSIKECMTRYESYCKKFLTRYASNEKMDAVKAIQLIPPEWNVINTKDKKDDLLFSYLVLALNDRISKCANIDIARRISEAEKLELEEKHAKLKKPYVMLTGNNRCRVCNGLLSVKAFCVYPNGEVTHMKCAKDVSVCPMTNVDFSKIPYK
eukprot:TRINITY_DN3597_c0_g3_i12.p1 TRINITY_DN3597_c0_g3~~TRINITY_DN3597_c0_g3_i12.p1  ORF type:complete len:946 (-),score=287.65 TRINITY_DN3597_c0_g3_i12:88-2925(-)